MFVNGLTMKQQVDRIYQTECFEMRRIGSISQFLTTEATKNLSYLLHSLVLEYCYFLLAGIPQKHENKVQRVN